MLKNMLIILVFCLNSLLAAEEIEFNFNSSYDGTEQKAAGFIPESVGKTAKMPLLVIAHYMGGDRFMAKQLGYYKAAEKHKYLLVCPELHGIKASGEFSLAALPAQHDILDSIRYMIKHYNVDESRIYLAGRSMGGMLAMIMAAKYPDRFAAVVAGQGISDLEGWIKSALPQLRAASEKELSPPSKKNRFEYRRRSAIYYARNFKYVPFFMWHGTNDNWVNPDQSSSLFQAIRKFNQFQPQVDWLLNAPHCAVNYPPEWIINRVKYYQNTCEVEENIKTRFFDSLDFITDEDQAFFWIKTDLKNKNKFCHITARLRGGLLSVVTTNSRAVTVNFDRIPEIVREKLKKGLVDSDSIIEFNITCKGKVIYSRTGRDFNFKIPVLEK
ncbi:alpha/beta fold hydrolase [Lentisphaerota bacterium ZTH]|nr:alpha/beta fold hydrolase [Lentisphaerota bacterium]WET07336.1 alpha/beta fold hydrolase [Lentisphaerota bacterium ZTH]